MNALTPKHLRADDGRGLREAFLESLRKGRADRRLAMQLWAYDDVRLPEEACDYLGLVPGSSFADAGRAALE